MTDNELFQKNLDRWAMICPLGLSAVIDALPQRISFCQSASGHLNLKEEIAGNTLFFHSPEDPFAEAHEWFSNLYLKDSEVIFVYGVGLGYYYDAAKEWLRANDRHYLAFFEDNPEVIHRLLETAQGTALLYDPQVALY